MFIEREILECPHLLSNPLQGGPHSFLNHPKWPSWGLTFMVEILVIQILNPLCLHVGF